MERTGMSYEEAESQLWDAAELENDRRRDDAMMALCPVCGRDKSPQQELCTRCTDTASSINPN